MLLHLPDGYTSRAGSRCLGSKDQDPARGAASVADPVSGARHAGLESRRDQLPQHLIWPGSKINSAAGSQRPHHRPSRIIRLPRPQLSEVGASQANPERAILRRQGAREPLGDRYPQIALRRLRGEGCIGHSVSPRDIRAEHDERYAKAASSELSALGRGDLYVNEHGIA
jgi:hypothetical protein